MFSQKTSVRACLCQYDLCWLVSKCCGQQMRCMGRCSNDHFDEDEGDMHSARMAMDANTVRTQRYVRQPVRRFHTSDIRMSPHQASVVLDPSPT